MEIVKEIFRNNVVNPSGRAVERGAVRGVIASGSELFMIHSTRDGDFKFPGGGIEAAETHQQTLSREIREECGANLLQFGPLFGIVVEYAVPMEAGYDVFKMTSYYYLCQVGNLRFDQQLDGYEQELGFRPEWIDIETAIRNNRNISQSMHGSKIPWLQREIFILEQVREQLIQDRDLNFYASKNAETL